MIELEIDISDFRRIKEAIGATEKIADLSFLMALKRTQRWLSTQVARALSKSLGVKYGAIKARVRLGAPTKQRLQARVWIGLNPLAAGKAGRPTGAKPGSNAGGRGRRGGQGVKVGRYRFPHAFILRGNRVVRRTTTKKYPLETVTIPIAEQAERVLVRKAWPDAQIYFLNEFERQMRFRMQRATS